MAEDQESTMKQVKREMEKSMSEFRSYVKNIFKEQDKGMVALQKECKATNEELQRQVVHFNGQVSELHGKMNDVCVTMNEVLSAIRGGGNHQGVPGRMQTGGAPITPQQNNVVGSPLAAYGVDNFAGMGIQARAKEIRDAELAATQTLERERQTALVQAQMLGNKCDNICGRTKTSDGRSGEQ